MSIRRSVAWTFASQIISFVAMFASSVIVARLLSPHEVGIYAIAVAALGIVQIVSAFGVSAYVVRDAELAPATLDSAFTVNALLALLLAAVIVAISLASGPLLGSVDAGRVLRVLALAPILGIFGFRAMAMLQREMQFRTIALIGTGSAVLAAAVTITGAATGASYMSAAYGGVASAAATAVAYNIVAPHHRSFRCSLASWRDLARFGVRIMSISGLAVVTARACDIILGRLLGLAALGLFSRASGLSSMIFDNVYGAATRVLFSQLSKDYREHGTLRETFVRGLQLITGVMWPLLVGLAVLSSPAIAILYGDKWLPAALPLSLLLLALVMALGFGMNWELFVIRDEVALQTRIELIRSVAMVTAFTIGCQFGLAWAAAGRLVDCFVGLVLYWPHIRRLAETRRGELPRVYLESAGLTAAAVAPALALMIATDWSAHPPVALLGGAVAAGVLLWVAALALMRHPLMTEIRTLSRLVRRRAPAVVEV